MSFRVVQTNPQIVSCFNLTDQYQIYTNVVNTWQLINLTYQNIVRNPFPVTPSEVLSAIQDPTIYQTSLELLTGSDPQYPIPYTYPVYTYVWQVNLENSDLSNVVYHPNPLFTFGKTASEMDAITGTTFITTTLNNFATDINVRPYSYQVFYIEYEWIGGLKKAYVMTYFPKPNMPYNNDQMSPDYNPCYIVGSGVL